MDVNGTLTREDNVLRFCNIVAFVPTLDAQRAKAFYADVLGLRLVSDDEFALVFDAGGTTLRIVRVNELTPAPFTVLGWQVENIEEVVAGLGQDGVQFEFYGFFEQDALGIWTAPTGDRVAWFKDPDGNTLSISQHVL